MKQITLLIITGTLLITSLNTFAQIVNPEIYHNNIEAEVGIQGIPNSNSGVDLRIDLSYGYFFRNGVGFRIGATYTPKMYDIGKATGTPVSFAWRTFNINKSYSTDNIDYDYNPDYMLHQDYSEYVKEQIATGLARFLSQIANSIEIDAGVTPGCIFGERANSFYLTGDLGLKTSWRIWRFNVNINPAMHYMITDSIDMGKYKVQLSSWEKWHLSLLFGVNFMF